MAPEVISQSHYDGRADVWSLGITVIEMAEGKSSFLIPIIVLTAVSNFLFPRHRPATSRKLKPVTGYICHTL